MKSNTLIGYIIKRLMFERGLKTAQLARMIGIPQPTLHRIVEGTSVNPHFSTVMTIASYFGLTVEQLYGEEPISWMMTLDEQISNTDWHRIPLLEWNEILLWLDNNSMHLILLNRASLLTDAQVNTGAFALRMVDASMEPYFPPSCTLIFDPKKEIYDRCFVVAHLAQENKFIFRQLLQNAGQYFLRPTSPDLQSMPLTGLTKQDRICGVLAQSKYDYCVRENPELDQNFLFN